MKAIPEAERRTNNTEFWIITDSSGGIRQMTKTNNTKQDAHRAARESNIADWWHATKDGSLDNDRRPITREHLVVAPHSPVRFHVGWRVRWTEGSNARATKHVVDHLDWKTARELWMKVIMEKGHAGFRRVIRFARKP